MSLPIINLEELSKIEINYSTDVDQLFTMTAMYFEQSPGALFRNNIARQLGILLALRYRDFPKHRGGAMLCCVVLCCIMLYVQA